METVRKPGSYRGRARVGGPCYLSRRIRRARGSDDRRIPPTSRLQMVKDRDRFDPFAHVARTTPLTTAEIGRADASVSRFVGRRACWDFKHLALQDDKVCLYATSMNKRGCVIGTTQVGRFHAVRFAQTMRIFQVTRRVGAVTWAAMPTAWWQPWIMDMMNKLLWKKKGAQTRSGWKCVLYERDGLGK